VPFECASSLSYVNVFVYTDDGRELSVPVLLDGEESIMEFIDLPYSGVSIIQSIDRSVNQSVNQTINQLL